MLSQVGRGKTTYSRQGISRASFWSAPSSCDQIQRTRAASLRQGYTRSSTGASSRSRRTARWTRRVVAKFRQNFVRFRRYRRRSLQINSIIKYAFCSISQNLPDFLAKIFEIWQHFANLATFAKFCWILTKFAEFSNRFFAKILRSQRCKSVHIL